MKITDALYGEHGLFYGYFGFLEAALDAIEKADDGTYAGYGAALRTLAEGLGEMVETHSRIEEDVLFPALEQHIGPAGPMTVMRAEHTEIDRVLARARSSTESAVVVADLRELLALLRAHFRKEEQVLFVLAARVLDDGKLHALGRRWAERRDIEVPDPGAAATCFG